MLLEGHSFLLLDLYEEFAVDLVALQLVVSADYHFMVGLEEGLPLFQEFDQQRGLLIFNSEKIQLFFQGYIFASENLSLSFDPFFSLFLCFIFTEKMIT